MCVSFIWLYQSATLEFIQEGRYLKDCVPLANAIAVSCPAVEEKGYLAILEISTGVMAKWSGLFLLGVSALFGVVVSLPCEGGLTVCKEDGVRLEEELPSLAIPVSAMSQCAAPQFCDASTPGTGHEMGLFPELTDGIVAVERCYSYCFGKVGQRECTN